MALLYHEHVDISSRIFMRLIFAFLFISTTYIFGSLLTANGNLRQLNILAGITVFLNIGLNLLLIPRFKAEGAAYASIFSQGFYAVSQVFIARNMFKLNTDFSTIIKLTALSVSLILTGILLRFFHSPWIAGFLALSFLSLIFSWLLKIITPQEVIGILKNQ